jgi:hypothetical protein
MRVIFAKINSERLPQFDIITKIIIDDTGEKIALKEPVTSDALPHIEAIYNNYTLLNDKYKINLATPTLKNNKIYFKMAKGESLEVLLLRAIETNDSKTITTLLNRYLALLDSMVSLRNTQFIPSIEFAKTFGDWNIETPQDIIDIPNVDLLFSNIFIDGDNITLIDYEWVFNYPIPKNFIAWRAFNIFNHFHNQNIAKYNLNHFFEHNKLFTQLEQKFCSSVYGKGYGRSIEKKLLKQKTEPFFINDILVKILGHKFLFFSTIILKKILFRKS